MSFLLGATLMTAAFVGAVVTIAQTACFYKKFKAFNNEYADSGSLSYGQTAKLDWSTIRKIYFVNKKRWRYEKVSSSNCRSRSDYPCLLYNTGDVWAKAYDDLWGNPYYKNRNKIVRVQLSFPDYVKFMWAKKFAKTKDIGSEMILASAQEDIEALRNKALNQIQEAQKQMAQVVSKEKSTEPKLELFTGER